MAPVRQWDSDAFCPSITKHSQSFGLAACPVPPLSTEPPLGTTVVAALIVVMVVVDVDGPLVVVTVTVVVQSGATSLQSSIRAGFAGMPIWLWQWLSSTLGQARSG